MNPSFPYSRVPRHLLRSGAPLVWRVLALLATSVAPNFARADEPGVRFAKTADRVEIAVGPQRVATYVFGDKEILRPYFTAVATTSGRQVTRNHPPREGTDPTDHAAMHPGIWVAFGDLGGEDFWRNKGEIVQRRFAQEPQAEGTHGSFVVENEYVSTDPGGKEKQTLCREQARWSIVTQAANWWLVYDGQFTAAADKIAFGDQEEMGLGVRLATPLSVAKGGEIRDADGGKNEKAIWGRQAAWCDYRGAVNGRRIGVAVVPHAENFRKTWWHVRDYGLLVANPFGQNAFTRGEKSRVELNKDKPLRLRFAVLLHDSATGAELDVAGAYKALGDSAGPSEPEDRSQE
jgi:hypothetical protein